MRTTRQHCFMPHREDIAVSDTAEISQNAEPGADIGTDQSAIDTLRGQIDALDTAIARLVAERAQLSRRIQSARMNAGGTRVELGRERAILNHYRTSLGSEGAALAEAVLRVCRGAR
jgi:monofunctional chorismate mutase